MVKCAQQCFFTDDGGLVIAFEKRSWLINIKKLQSTFKKSCYRPCSHRSKTAKIKRERGRERDSGNSSSYEAYNTIA
jgi:hypothetical protein